MPHVEGPLDLPPGDSLENFRDPTASDHPLDLADGDHFAGMPHTVSDGHSHYPGPTNIKPPFVCAECGAQIGHHGTSPWEPIGSSVIDEITDEVGEAPMPCPVRSCIVEGLNDPEALEAHLQNEHTLEERRGLVIDEITDEIDNGDAHLMTRNELVEFIDWWVLLDSELNANQQIADAMERANGFTIPLIHRERLAKMFFVLKGYEN